MSRFDNRERLNRRLKVAQKSETASFGLGFYGSGAYRSIPLSLDERLALRTGPRSAGWLVCGAAVVSRAFLSD